MRYGIYYAPAEDSAFWRLGSTWLGRDAATGEPLAQPDVPGIRERTVAPHRYGLHATLKAPIALADGSREEEFLEAVEAWAARETPFVLPPLEVACLGDFVALRPAGRCPELEATAARCVRDLDRFRRPAGNAELARRRPEALPGRERGYLVAWGYPYVFDAYRFHVTLSDGIADPHERQAFQAAAAGWMAGADLSAEPVADACVFVEFAPNLPFRLVYRFRFNS
ncbi:conserved hypothetical protein [uncultured Alphaproteobacteria bacterium]|uniref:Phosphonate metabolism protein n=1 Tax=uncultured Alphaproteobacteria bacterium TaxID=91750 RepID=A0A212J4V3_9PROT|nr:conserved hypothetical protein [uncultured Alphaproteobacteria bacterium]